MLHLTFDALWYINISHNTFYCGAAEGPLCSLGTLPRGEADIPRDDYGRQLDLCVLAAL